MSWAGVLRLIGLLLTLFSVSFLPPLAVSVATGDGETLHFVETLAITLAAGGILWTATRNARTELKVRDGFLVVALFWSVLGVFGSIPLILGAHLGLTDAIFESVSGFTTTGATVIIGLDSLPPSILYHRQQLQWLGGMGVIVLAVAIIPMLGVGGMQLYRAETPGPIKDDKLSPRIMHTARTLWYIYLGLTVLCAIAYWIAGMSAFDAIGHAFSTVATGGYSTHDASIGHFDSLAIETIANVFMLLGAINFGLHFIAFRERRIGHYGRDPEARTFLLLVLGFSLLSAGTLWFAGGYAGAGSALRDATFQIVSVITSTGFATTSFADWPLYLPLVVAAISFIGGCAGSTAGGMKVVRVMLLYKQGLRETFHLTHPRALKPIKLGDKPVADSVMQSVWGFYSLYVLSSLVLTGLMMAAGLDLESAFGAVVASINLLGPGLGEVASSFATVPASVKWLAVFAMLLGRLEIFTLFILFTPAFWRQ